MACLLCRFPVGILREIQQLPFLPLQLRHYLEHLRHRLLEHLRHRLLGHLRHLLLEHLRLHLLAHLRHILARLRLLLIHLHDYPLLRPHLLQSRHLLDS